MKVLVTGAGGFIGGHLVERLLRDGHDVIAVDVVDSVKTLTSKKVTVYTCDLTLVKEINSLKLRLVDWVFHLAGRSDIVPSIVDPLAYHAVNVTGTINLLEACQKAHIKRFVYAASSSCYGIPDVYPTPETAPMRPMYPYALTKYMGELYVMHWAAVYKLPAVSLRFFNVYGPRSRASSDYGPVFSTFMAQKLAGKPFTVVGDGNQKRDFTFVTDVVDACITAAKSDIVREAFNVGSGGTYSINSLVKLLKGPVVYIPKRPGEPDCTWADISKIKKVLGWKPKISFKEGISIVLSHIQEWKNAPVWSPETISRATEDWFKYLG